MQVYTQDDELIERWQWNDPALRNLSDVVMSLLEGQSGRVLDLAAGGWWRNLPDAALASMVLMSKSG